MTEPEPETKDHADDLVRFFRGLPPKNRAEIDALAKLDKAHGEDVSHERPPTERSGS